jgi:hypothetical protein
MSKTECGETAHTYHNETDDPAKAEVTIESVTSEGGCKGAVVRISGKEKWVSQHYKNEFPAGPDLYK